MGDLDNSTGCDSNNETAPFGYIEASKLYRLGMDLISVYWMGAIVLVAWMVCMVLAFTENGRGMGRNEVERETEGVSNSQVDCEAAVQSRQPDQSVFGEETWRLEDAVRYTHETERKAK